LIATRSQKIGGVALLGINFTYREPIIILTIKIKLNSPKVFLVHPNVEPNTIKIT